MRVPLVDLGLTPELRSEYIRAYDLEIGRPVTFDPWNGEITTKVKPHDFRLIVIRTYRD